MGPIECQSAWPQGGQAQPLRPRVRVAVSCRAEEERPVSSQAEDQTGIGQCPQEDSVLQHRDPCSQHIPVAVKDQGIPLRRVVGYGLYPKPLMHFEGPGESPVNCEKELVTPLYGHRAWGLPLLGQISLHPPPRLAPLPVFPEFFSALKISRAPS